MPFIFIPKYCIILHFSDWNNGFEYDLKAGDIKLHGQTGQLRKLDDYYYHPDYM